MNDNLVVSSDSVSPRFARTKRAQSPNALAAPSSPSKRPRRESVYDSGLASSPTRAQDAKIHRFSQPRVDATGRPEQRLGGFAAQRWFEESNNDVFTNTNLDSASDTSPFYLRDSPFGLDSAYAPPSQPSSNRVQAEPPRPYSTLGQDNTSGSMDDDYRSVIDDLTIENRDLKKRLRKYEKLHCSHLQQERLFEVRAPGLPECEKQKLETVLRRFAATLDDPRSTRAVNAENLRMQRHPVSKTTLLKPRRTPADSAYASNSSSDMIIPSFRLPDRTYQEKPRPSTEVKNQTIELYIKHMPRENVPSRPPKLSDAAKMEMIVKRLEQVFTGSSATRRRPQLSQQQHEISASAAMLEESAGGMECDAGISEGSREARILPAIYENLDSTSGAPTWNNCYNDPLSDSAKSKKEAMPDQRPTRPMDFDLYRPQVGVDNMEYIRHLGLAFPVRGGEGWVYLNLLSNMAQLHTFSVTSDFVRKAIAKPSSGFDLSPDGQQVRCRDTVGTASGKSGSSDGTRKGPHEGVASDDKFRNFGASAPRSNTYLRATLKHRSPDTSNVGNGHTRDCVPLFTHGDSWADSYPSKNSNPDLSRGPSELDSSGQSNRFETLPPSRIEEASSHRKGGNGPIIFYKQATFCTDLSGHIQTSMTKYSTYARFSMQPLGQRPNPADYGDYSSEQSESAVRVLSTALPFTTDTDSKATSETGFDFPDIESLSSQPGSGDVEPFRFEASGLAGVQPEDHFLVDVATQLYRPRRARIRSSPFSHPGRHTNRGQEHHDISSRPVSTLIEPGTPLSLTDHLITHNHVLCTKTTDLPPSSLPHPSYICLPFSSSGSDDDGANESESISDDSRDPSNSGMSEDDSIDDDDIPLPTGHLPVPLSPERYVERQPTSEDEQDSDESIDLLASARSRDRWAVAAWEMDYDANGTTSVSDLPANGSTFEGAI